MDQIDLQLLDLIQRDARLSYARLGQEVGLSTSAVNERLKKLQGRGIIRGFVA
ncbi:MAG: Lrp/AsnC family transcriptional regulator, partial [Deltaproteobacteria bacterium]|nr:Lrp/AsnC family transcriptional regulator [Deltaproteobacteria bacterium]